MKMVTFGRYAGLGLALVVVLSATTVLCQLQTITKDNMIRTRDKIVDASMLVKNQFGLTMVEEQGIFLGGIFQFLLNVSGTPAAPETALAVINGLGNSISTEQHFYKCQGSYNEPYVTMHGNVYHMDTEGTGAINADYPRKSWSFSVERVPAQHCALETFTVDRTNESGGTMQEIYQVMIWKNKELVHQALGLKGVYDGKREWNVVLAMVKGNGMYWGGLIQIVIRRDVKIGGHKPVLSTPKLAVLNRTGSVSQFGEVRHQAVSVDADGKMELTITVGAFDIDTGRALTGSAAHDTLQIMRFVFDPAHPARLALVELREELADGTRLDPIGFCPEGFQRVTPSSLLLTATALLVGENIAHLDALLGAMGRTLAIFWDGLFRLFYNPTNSCFILLDTRTLQEYKFNNPTTTSLDATRYVIKADADLEGQQATVEFTFPKTYNISHTMELVRVDNPTELTKDEIPKTWDSSDDVYKAITSTNARPAAEFILKDAKYNFISANLKAAVVDIFTRGLSINHGVVADGIEFRFYSGGAYVLNYKGNRLNILNCNVKEVGTPGRFNIELDHSPLQCQTCISNVPHRLIIQLDQSKKDHTVTSFGGDNPLENNP
eukprot:GHVS01055090.1.p1 GENE.GHVS01055090.1~~GHVS01055090.1.p1  ORF type:complete len:607 (-),score=30.69 GHVS01055090.1:316-2136(-)